MKEKIILLLLIVVLGGVYFGINYFGEQGRITQNSVSGLDFSKYSFNYIKTDKIEIKNKKIIYYGTGEYITDTDKMDKFISDLKEIKVKSIVSTKVENFEKFGITSSGSFVTLDNSKIIPGKNNGYYGEEYIKLDGIDKVYLIDKNLKNILDKDEEFFRKIETKKVETGSGLIRE